MRIFLTGGTGSIGRNLARSLVEAGHEVRALVRTASAPEKVEALTGLGIATFVGDVTDRASMREGMSGADWVVHAAADVLFNAPPDRMRATNVQGSENVASLAYKLGVGRFLSVSTMAWWGGSPPDGSVIDETAPPRPEFPSLYAATKHSGELAIQEWAKKGLKVNTVFPSLVYGPALKNEGANGILRGMLAGRFPVLVGAGTKTTWVYLDDVLDGILAVMEKAPPGRGYLLAGDVTTLRQLANRVCDLGGVRRPRLDVPVGLVRGASAVVSPFLRLLGGRPLYSREQLAGVELNFAFSDARARSELGWLPRTLDEGLPPTVEYLKTH